jgi:hypothetical protein
MHRTDERDQPVRRIGVSPARARMHLIDRLTST